MIKSITNRMTEREYRKLDRLSASDIRKFLTKGRKVFYKKVILGQEEEDEEESRSSTIGSLVHCLVLEPENFDEKFYRGDSLNRPTGKMLDFVNSLVKYSRLASDENGEILETFEEIAKKAYNDSGFSWTFETVISKFKSGGGERYYRDIRNSQGKTTITLADVEIAEKIKDRLLGDDIVGWIFRGASKKELQLDNFNVLGLDMKCMIDILEESENFLQPYDLKVTWQCEEFKKNYFLKERADIQALVYSLAVEQVFGKKPDNFRFIVADSANFSLPLIYEMSDETLEKAMEGFSENGKYYPGLRETIEEIQWHTETGIWNMSKEAYKNNRIFKL